MYELDKERFGEFLAVQRKKKGYTQKELAKRLFVSDKTVSKWERGGGMPDVSLLIPLGEILGVTVTELLEGQEVAPAIPMDAQQVENLVKRAITLSEENPKTARMRKKRCARIFAAAALAAFLETFLLFATVCNFEDGVASGFFVMETLSVFFGGYFFVGIKEKLPAYYDENPISAYSDGIFRMNLPGVCFTNNNWPYIVKTGRIWSVSSMVGLPVLILAGMYLIPPSVREFASFALLILFLGGLFIPLYAAAKKYE